MSLYKLTLFGGFDLTSSEQGSIDISAKKAKALLAYLALQPNKVHQREILASLLWDECSSTQARQSLRQTLSALRKTLNTGESMIDGDQQLVFLHKDQIEIDVLNFDKLCKQDDKASLPDALELYQGELLEGLYTRSQGFDDWLEMERSQRREKALQIMDSLLEEAQSGNQLEQVIRLGIKMTALDPLRESVHRVLMNTYNKQGRRNAALKQYRLCQQLLRDELTIAPEQETQTLYQVIFRQQKPITDQLISSVTENQVIIDEVVNSKPLANVDQLRQVTLLSVHVDSADSDNDPESLYHRRQQICEKIKEFIQDFQATVIEMQNGSLMILFGLPTAQSYDTEKAVRAAFTLRNKTDTEKQALSKCTIQIGIDSGQIYIPDAQQPASLSGATVKFAMSLADFAQPGQILISNRAFTTIAQLVTAEEFAIKDSIDHKQIWRLIEIADNKQQRATQMVGRKFELQQFLTAARNCKETEYGQLILVRGEAGIGKTRLLKEWLTSANDLGFNSHSVSIFDFGTSLGKTPVQTLARSLLQLQPDSELAKIENGALKLVAENLLSNEQVNFLFDLLNVSELLRYPEIYQAMDNDARQFGKQEVMTTLVQRLSECQPLLIIMEDIHWAEPALLTLLGQLAADIKDYPIILVFSTRFEGEPLDPLWRSQIQSTPLLTLDISPLRQNEAEQLVKQTLDLVADKTAELIQRSGCNPLFLEQLLFCVEQAVDVIPDSVQSIIAAKLDTLDSFDKRAAFSASILGQRFSLEPLKYILDSPSYDCSRLLARGLIKPDGSQFLFHHALIMDGIYTIQLPSQRRSLHLLAADWYNDKDPLLYAEHLDKAESEHAANAYLKTAEHFMKLYQYDSAEKMAKRGKEIAKETEDLFNLSICRANCSRELGQTQISLEAFIEAEQQAASPIQQCQALIGQGFALRLLDRHEEVLSLIKTTEPIAESLNNIEALATLHYLRGNACFFLGDIDNCLLAHQQAETISADHKLPIIQVHSLSGLADANYAMGRIITAEQQYNQCITLCKQYDLIRDATANQVMLGIVLGFLNRFDDAVKILLETLELAKKVRNLRAETLSLGKLGYIYTQTNERKSAELCANQYLQLSKQSGSTLSQSHALLYLGILDKNESLLVQAYELASINSLGKYHLSSWILAAQAWVTDDSNKRARALQEGEKLLSEHALSHNHLMFYRYAIESCLDTKDYDKTQHFITALKRYTAKQPLPWSDFIIKRAKALIRTGQGETGEELEQDLHELVTQADQAGFIEAKACILTALQQIKGSSKATNNE
jgi:DNA-binding SARP family transcriptional activator/predicted ATPase/class 3 adenylate cyclase